MSDAPVTLTPPSPSAAAAPRSGQRLAWLDALRGFAALCVVFDHLAAYAMPHLRGDIYRFLDPGTYGVFVFFLVSGYIVPASLERKGSVRGFWVSRVFRLYPLYAFALVTAVLLWWFNIGTIGGANYQAKTSLLTHALMLSTVLGGHNAINVIWTLTYEMAFYLLLTALFLTGTHRRSSRWALLFAAAALGLGGLLPMAALSHSFLGSRLVPEIADLFVLAGIALAVTRFRVPRTVGAILAGGTVLVLVLCNGNWVPPYEALTILALMFTGTMLYRAERGDYPWRRAVPAAITVLLLATAAGLWHGWIWGAAYRWQWATSVLGAGLTFAIGMACRKKQVPSVLAWLGVVSFSVYLVHPLLIQFYKKIPFTHGSHPFGVQVLMAAVFLAVLLACSWLSYRWVEKPMQRHGRTFSRWLDTWFGPDPVPGAPAVAPEPALAHEAIGPREPVPGPANH
ncbi:MAG TPA: acyltransferase [Streptosporangiaceae bacterium]